MPADLTVHLPLKPVDFEILFALAQEEQHGYGLVQTVRTHTEGLIDLDPGNLYRVIKRLIDAGLVAEADHRPSADAGGERRRYYRITATGTRVLSAELGRLRRLVHAASTRQVARKVTS